MKCLDMLTRLELMNNCLRVNNKAHPSLFDKTSQQILSKKILKSTQVIQASIKPIQQVLLRKSENYSKRKSEDCYENLSVSGGATETNTTSPCYSYFRTR